MKNKAVGEDILNSITVIKGLNELFFKNNFPKEAAIVDQEVNNIYLLTIDFFKLEKNRITLSKIKEV